MKCYYLNKLSSELMSQYINSELYLEEVLNDYSCTITAINYYLEYFQNKNINQSLIVFDNNLPVLVVYIYSKNNVLSFFEEPIKIFEKCSTKQIQNEAYRTLFLKLEELIKFDKISQLIYRNNSFFNSYFYNNITEVKRQDRLLIPLELDASIIQMNLRKSYKSLINWGKKNLEIQYFNKENITEHIWNDFKNFHIAVAGKKTRSDESWQLQFQSLLSDESFLIMSYLNGKLVGSTYVLLSKTTSYYGVGVYDRELMSQKLPISHFNLLMSIFYAKKLNKLWYDLGFLNNENSNSKEIDIFNFKKGFTNNITFENIVKINY